MSMFGYRFVQASSIDLDTYRSKTIGRRVMYLDDFGQPIGSAGVVVEIPAVGQLVIQWEDDGTRSVSRPPGYGVSLVWLEEYDRAMSRWGTRKPAPLKDAGFL